MTSLALTASALLLTLIPASADLSWEYIEKRQADQRKTIENAKRTVEKVSSGQSSPEARAAYVTLGKALNTHPAMATVNANEAAARHKLKKAHAAKDAELIATAQSEVAQTSMARFQKAASIPELAKLITTWREASTSGVTTTNSPQIEKNLNKVEIGLGDLFE